MKKGSSDRYFQGSVNEANKLVPEGIEGRVAYKGAAADIVFQMIGGIRSGMGYCGAANLKELHDNAQFIEMSGAGLKKAILMMYKLLMRHQIILCKNNEKNSSKTGVLFTMLSIFIYSNFTILNSERYLDFSGRF